MSHYDGEKHEGNREGIGRFRNYPREKKARVSEGAGMGMGMTETVLSEV